MVLFNFNIVKRKSKMIDFKCRKFTLKIKISRFEAFSVIMQEKNYEKIMFFQL